MKGKMTRVEAGKLGSLKSRKVQREKKNERIEKYNLNPKLCKNCGEQIVYHKKRQTFCSQRCNGLYNNRDKKYIIKEIICPVCNDEFKPKRKNAIYCSPDCHRKKKWGETIDKIKKGETTSPKTIKKYLIESNPHKCEICGTIEWQRKPVPLIMDHIDGNSENNDLSNLRLVCPNCDAQLPTYKGKNKGNGRHYRRERYAAGKSY